MLPTAIIDLLSQMHETGNYHKLTTYSTLLSLAFQSTRILRTCAIYILNIYDMLCLLINFNVHEVSQFDS